MSGFNKEQQRAFGRLIVEGFKKGDASMVKGCLEKGADPNVSVQNGDSGPWRPVLHWGAQFFNEDCMQAMIDFGANLEERTSNGETALYHAVGRSETAAVKFLMQKGADPVALDSNGKTPIDVALGLRADYESYVKTRTAILKVLAVEGPADGQKAQPRQVFNDKSVPEAEAAKGITAPKTASFGQKEGHKDKEPPKKGFSL